jgi:hypothetical protein
MNIYDELEKFQNVEYRMDAEGFHYCFESYSSFQEIEDTEFHRLREAYLTASRNLEIYVNKTIDSLLETIDNDESQD